MGFSVAQRVFRRARLPRSWSSKYKKQFSYIAIGDDNRGDPNNTNKGCPTKSIYAKKSIIWHNICIVIAKDFPTVSHLLKCWISLYSMNFTKKS